MYVQVRHRVSYVGLGRATAATGQMKSLYLRLSLPLKLGKYAPTGASSYYRIAGPAGASTAAKSRERVKRVSEWKIDRRWRT